jgi:hypothetical protein
MVGVRQHAEAAAVGAPGRRRITMRFTVDGSEALERRIASDMATVRARVIEAVHPEDLTALVLGGGYGRGEGGVLEVEGGERVYNDYDFFVVVPYTSRGRRKTLTEKLNGVKAVVEPACGIHVDFSPPMPASGLGKLPYELMFMEAKMGHHVVIGPADIFSALPAYDTECPPLEECARLFMNRGIGLLLASTKLMRPSLSEEDHEFVVRNIYKAMMAMGDSVLFIRRDYSPSYIERRARFLAQDLQGVPEGVREVYEASLDFKLRPRHEVPPGKTLDDWHREVTALYLQVYLWFERQRLGMPTLDWAGYAKLPSRLPGTSAVERLKNVVRNLRHGRPVGGEWILHPRDRILKRLPALLGSHAQDSAELMHVLHIWKNYG